MSAKAVDDTYSQVQQVEKNGGGGQGQSTSDHPFWFSVERRAKKSTEEGGRSQGRWLRGSTVLI